MKIETVKTTTNSKVYKRLMRKILDNYEGLCPICAPHKGCNSWKKYKGTRNWKKYRKTQYWRGG